MYDVLNILDSSGHVRIEWDPNNPKDVEDAKKTIQDLKSKGYAFFSVLGDPTKSPMESGHMIVHRTEDLISPPDDVVPEDSPVPMEVSTKGNKVKCTGTSANGEPCNRNASLGSDRCWSHQREESAPKLKPKRRQNIAVPPMQGG